MKYQFKRYVIQFISEQGNYYHCVGLPADPADISNAMLIDEKALNTAIEKNCYKWVGVAGGGSEKVRIPHCVLEVNCSLA